MLQQFSQNKYFKAINIVLVALALWYLWNKLKQINSEDFLQILNQSLHNKTSLVILVVVILLMIINWSIESLKWKLLLNTLQKIDYADAIKSVLAGLTISIFTPNRTGEIVGKVFYLELKEKMKAALINFSGSLAQMIFTCIMGLWSWYVLLVNYQLSLPYFINSNILFYLSFACTISAMLIYFNQLRFLTWLSKKSWAKKIDIAFTNPQQFSNTLQVKVLLLAMLRYFVFVTQLVGLLYFCDVIIPLPIAFLCCSMYFFLVWFLPSIAIFDLGIRGSVALILFGNFSNHHAGILLASTLLWTVNIALPSLIGTVFVYRIKWKIN